MLARLRWISSEMALQTPRIMSSYASSQFESEFIDMNYSLIASLSLETQYWLQFQ